ncbi:unnamed protein product [Closterium sp. Yama58-4]|nr:unnamed protein product [Closterium sp. Yama58-4]
MAVRPDVLLNQMAGVGIDDDTAVPPLICDLRLPRDGLQTPRSSAGQTPYPPPAPSISHALPWGPLSVSGESECAASGDAAAAMAASMSTMAATMSATALDVFVDENDNIAAEISALQDKICELQARLLHPGLLNPNTRVADTPPQAVSASTCAEAMLEGAYASGTATSGEVGVLEEALSRSPSKGSALDDSLLLDAMLADALRAQPAAQGGLARSSSSGVSALSLPEEAALETALKRSASRASSLDRSLLHPVNAVFTDSSLLPQPLPPQPLTAEAAPAESLPAEPMVAVDSPPPAPDHPAAPLIMQSARTSGKRPRSPLLVPPDRALHEHGHHHEHHEQHAHGPNVHHHSLGHEHAQGISSPTIIPTSSCPSPCSPRPGRISPPSLASLDLRCVAPTPEETPPFALDSSLQHHYHVLLQQQVDASHIPQASTRTALDSSLRYHVHLQQQQQQQQVGGSHTSEASTTSDEEFFIQQHMHQQYLHLQHPSQQHPSQQHPSQQNPSQQNPSQQNPSQQNPSQQNPSQQNPSQKNRSQQNPSQQHPPQQNLPQIHLPEQPLYQHNLPHQHLARLCLDQMRQQKQEASLKKEKKELHSPVAEACSPRFLPPRSPSLSRQSLSLGSPLSRCSSWEAGSGGKESTTCFALVQPHEVVQKQQQPQQQLQQQHRPNPQAQQQQLLQAEAKAWHEPGTPKQQWGRARVFKLPSPSAAFFPPAASPAARAVAWGGEKATTASPAASAGTADMTPLRAVPPKQRRLLVKPSTHSTSTGELPLARSHSAANEAVSDPVPLAAVVKAHSLDSHPLISSLTLPGACLSPSAMPSHVVASEIAARIRKTRRLAQSTAQAEQFMGAHATGMVTCSHNSTPASPSLDSHVVIPGVICAKAVHALAPYSTGYNHKLPLYQGINAFSLGEWPAVQCLPDVNFNPPAGGKKRVGRKPSAGKFVKLAPAQLTPARKQEDEQRQQEQQQEQQEQQQEQQQEEEQHENAAESAGDGVAGAEGESARERAQKDGEGREGGEVGVEVGDGGTAGAGTEVAERAVGVGTVEGSEAAVDAAVAAVNQAGQRLLLMMRSIDKHLSFWRRLALASPAQQLWIVLFRRGPLAFLHTSLSLSLSLALSAANRYLLPLLPSPTLPASASSSRSAPASPSSNLVQPSSPQTSSVSANRIVTRVKQPLSPFLTRLATLLAPLYRFLSALWLSLQTAPLLPLSTLPHPPKPLQNLISDLRTFGSKTLNLYLKALNLKPFFFVHLHRLRSFLPSVASAEGLLLGLAAPSLQGLVREMVAEKVAVLGEVQLALSAAAVTQASGIDGEKPTSAPGGREGTVESSGACNEAVSNKAGGELGGAGVAADGSGLSVSTQRAVPAAAVVTRETVCGEAKQLNEDVKSLEKLVSAMVARCHRPRHAARHWLEYLAGGLCGVAVGSWVVRHSRLNGSDDLDRWAADGWRAVTGFVTDHIWQPLSAISAELFHTFSDQQRGNVSMHDVQASTDSLRRMLLTFVEKTQPLAIDSSSSSSSSNTSGGTCGSSGSGTTGAADASVGAGVPSESDLMAVVMREYEKDMANPLTHLLTGRLAEALLIQVQRMKLHIETAMLELEQILRANQINFALLTALPALLLLSGLFSLSRDFSVSKARGVEGKGRVAQTRRRMLLADVERHVLLRNHLRMSASSKALPPAQSLESTSAVPSTSAAAPDPGSTSVSTPTPSSAPCDDVAASASDVASVYDVAAWHGTLVYLLHRLYVAVQRQASKGGEWSRLQQDILDIASPHMDMQGRQLLAARMAAVYDCLVPLAK